MPKEEKKKTKKTSRLAIPGEVRRPKAAVKEKVAVKKVAGAEDEKKSSIKEEEDVSLQDAHAAAKKPERYFEGVGRRKTAIARVRLFTRTGDFTVNGKPHNIYFPLETQKIAEEALQKMKLWGRFKVTALVKGGGLHSQAEALRHGLSRCLVKFNPDFRKRLRRADFLKRDPRMKERKKPGLKRARKAPQWSKR